MAASDKLIPLAKIMAKSLTGFPANSSAGYAMPPARKASALRNPYTDAVYFFAGIYAKAFKISGGDATWNQTTVDGRNLPSLYVPNRNAYGLILGSVIATTEFEWKELQETIDKAFSYVYPFDIAGGSWSASDVAYYNQLMGVFGRGTGATSALTGADGSPLGTHNQGSDFAIAWNTLKVPYDATINVKTQFIAPIAPLGGHVPSTVYYYRYTGARRWFNY